MDAPIVLTPTQAAALLGVSKTTLRTLKRLGKIAWVPVGRGGVGYRREDVQAFVDSSVRRNGLRVVKKPVAPASAASAFTLPTGINSLTGRPYGSGVAR